MEESKLQSKCFIWFNNTYCLRHHDPRFVMFSVPNELGNVLSGILKSSGLSQAKIKSIIIKIMNKFKAMGLTSGVSDTIIVMNNKTIFCEFKTDTGSQSDSQKDFEKRITDLNFEYWVIRDFEEFKNKIQNYETK